MSTWLYLTCLDHDPVLEASGESGQHLSDLAQIRADLANREAIIYAWDDDWTTIDHYRRNTAYFLTRHPKCRIGIRDEYGTTHPLTEGGNTDKPQAPQIGPDEARAIRTVLAGLGRMEGMG